MFIYITFYFCWHLKTILWWIAITNCVSTLNIKQAIGW